MDVVWPAVKQDRDWVVPRTLVGVADVQDPGFDSFTLDIDLRKKFPQHNSLAKIMQMTREMEPCYEILAVTSSFSCLERCLPC